MAALSYKLWLRCIGFLIVIQSIQGEIARVTMKGLMRKWRLLIILSLLSQSQSAGAMQRQASDCKWREIPDVYSNGTTFFYSKAYDIDSCKEACLEVINDCIAVEYHSNPLCWYVTSSNKVNNYVLERGKGYMQYWLDCRIGLANDVSQVTGQRFPAFIDPPPNKNIVSVVNGTTAGGIPCHWQEVRDVQSKGSVLYVKAKGVQACKEACIQEITGCVAIDNHSSNYCFYHTNRTAVLNRREKVSTGKGYVQFLRVGQC